MGIITYCIAIFVLFSKICNTAPLDTSDLRCNQPADIVFVVDTSTSIEEKDFNTHVRTFLKEIISSFNIGQGPLDTRVGMLLFGSSEYLQFHLNKYSSGNDTLKAIDAIRYRGGDTYTYKALEYVSKWMLTPAKGARPNVTKIVIVLTDGESINTRKTLAAAKVIKDKGVDIFAVGVGNRLAYDELNSMATAPTPQYVFRVTDFRGLSSIKNSFSKGICEASSTTAKTLPTTTPATTTTTPTTITPTASTTTKPKQSSEYQGDEASSTTAKPLPATTSMTTTTAPTTSMPTTTTTTAITTTKPKQSSVYQGDEDSIGCDGRAADIYFLLDASSSVWIVHFQDQVLPFVRDLVSLFHILPLHTRIGLVTFSDIVNTEFNLSAFSDRKSLLASIQPEHVEYLTGQTNSGDAIKYISDIGFGPSQARQGVAQIIITVTNGQSQVPEFTANAAAEAKKKGVIMFAVGVGNHVDENNLTAISSDPNEDFVFHVETFSTLSSITEPIAIKTCDAIGNDNTHIIQQCSNITSNVVFVYEYFNSVSESKIILDDLVSRFSREVNFVSTEVKIGTLTQPCIGEGVSLLGISKFREAFAAVREGYDVEFSGLMLRLRSEVFYNVPKDNRNVAVLVLTPAIKDWDSVVAEAQKLKDMGVTLVVVAVGDIKMEMLEKLASAPDEEHVIRVKHHSLLKEVSLDVSNVVCGMKQETREPSNGGSTSSKVTTKT